MTRRMYVQFDVTNIVSTAAAAAIFSAGGAWAMVRAAMRDVKKLKQKCEQIDEELERSKHSRNVTRACISMLIDTVQDPARKRLLEIAWAAANSPVVIQYGPLRELVAARGRPPEYVIEGIRKIAEMDPKDDVEVLGYVNLTFTAEQLGRAARAHSVEPETPSRADFNELCRLFFADVRERGVDACLRDAGLIE